MYRSVYHALFRAYSTHHNALFNSPSIYNDSMGGYRETKIHTDDLTKLDRLIQDQYTRDMINKALNKDERHVVSAKYLQDPDEKAIECIYAGNVLYGILDSRHRRLERDHQYRSWCVMKWADYPLKNYSSPSIWLDTASRSSVRRDLEYVGYEMNTIIDRALLKIETILGSADLI